MGKYDIKEIGYKYQMTDMGACLLIDSLKNFKSILNHRKKLFDIYKSKLSKLKNLRVLDTLDKNLTIHIGCVLFYVKKDFFYKKN